MNNPVTIDQLRVVNALKDLPDEHLQWIIDRSEYSEVEEGGVFFKKGDPIDHMVMILEGTTSFYMDVNGRQVYFFKFENDEISGGMGGLLPYSRMKTSPGFGYADTKVRVLRLHKSYFHDLEQLNPDLIQRLIAIMTDRAKAFATMQLQQEKVSALGKLSAGIAHELNNPASAISRLSAELSQRQQLNLELTEKLLFHCIPAAQIHEIRKLNEEISRINSEDTKMSMREKMNHEDALSEWLMEEEIERGAILSETFAEWKITTAYLARILEIVGKTPFHDVLFWMENHLSVKRIISDLDHASARISALVGAIKSHVHMDRSNDMRPTNLAEDIDNTLMLLGHKLRDKNITIEKKYEDPMPEVHAFIGELNQVWMNLIDNAVFALPKKGQLVIEIFKKNEDIKVNIIDNGPGIPEDIKSRIFEPFFSTKKVGEGTGIGLDIVSRIVKHHNGDIKVNSKPGRTEFSVCIPLHQKNPVIPVQ